MKALAKGFFRLGIGKIPFNLETKKGFIDKRGIIHNGDFWRINISNKQGLNSLFTLIGPYLKHKDKIEAIKLAQENVKNRIDH